MRTWTYSEVREKVENDLDLQDEDFITANEMIGYCNEGIDECEAEIHSLNEDYFLASAPITLANGTANYSLPSDIYANKVRGMVYEKGEDIYEVKRIREFKKFLRTNLANHNPTQTEAYMYFISNDAGPKITLYPTAYEAGQYITIWYLRNAAKVPQVGDAKPVSGNYTQAEVDAYSLDIPEFTNFVIQFMKVRCMEKEKSPMLDEAITVLQQQRKMMVDTLTQMVPDDNDEIQADFSHYTEHT